MSKSAPVCIPCPHCQHSRSEVVDTRGSQSGYVRRRRQCGACGCKFSTREYALTNGAPGLRVDQRLAAIEEAVSQLRDMLQPREYGR